MPNIFVDTELWVYSLKKPDASKYASKKLHEQDMRKHLLAQSFFKNLKKGTTFHFTTHQICEIYHALRFRGNRLDEQFVRAYITSLISASSSKIIEPNVNDVVKSIDISIKSGIHVWDFLCIIPIKHLIEVAYTSDKHFTHQAMVDLGIHVENPIGTWDEI